MQFENIVLGLSDLLTLLASSIHVCFLSSSSTPIPITVSLQTNTYTHHSITIFEEEAMSALRPTGHIVADTLLPTQMFPRLPARATFVADTNFVSGTQKISLTLFRNILCPQQMFPSLRSPRNIMSNNVSATMCPRLPVP